MYLLELNHVPDKKYEKKNFYEYIILFTSVV